MKELRLEMLEKDAKIQAMQAEIQKLSNALNNNGVKPAVRRHHPLSATSTTITTDGAGELTQNRSRMGRHASISTANVLNAVPDENEDGLALRIVEMFKDPNKHLA
jgi:phosphate uptake regulator